MKENNELLKKNVEKQKDFLESVDFLSLEELFKMYADRTRLKIFSVLSVKECSVGELSETLQMSHSAISHQLSNLRKHNLVKGRKVGLNVFYSLADNHVMTIFIQALDHIQELSCDHDESPSQ